MADISKLSTGYTLLKQGTLWASTGKCKGFAAANPGEASQIDAYVSAILGGRNPTPPALATATGRGLVEIIDGGYGSAPVPGFTASITGQPVVGQTLAAVAS